MKTIRLHGQHDLRLNNEPHPIPQRGEKLIRVKSVGVCGSDLHWFSEGEIGDAKLEHPLILGHEFAGELARRSARGAKFARVHRHPMAVCQRPQRHAGWTQHQPHVHP